jgi:hypothetical protein
MTNLVNKSKGFQVDKFGEFPGIKDPVNLLAWILLGIPLLATYSTIDKSFWVGIEKNKNLYRFYLVYIILAFISGILMIVWSSKYELENEKESQLVTIGIIILVGFSIIWVPMFKESKNNLNYRWATILALLGATVGSCILAHTVLYPIVHNDSVDSYKYSKLWAIPVLFLVFQTGIMDLFVWNYYYLNFL